MDPFVAEIRIFGFNFPPTGWAFCDGQLMPISQNTALFSLVGTYYGGDGKSTFGLPNLQGQSAMHAGQGPGLTDRFLGEPGGEQSVTLIQSEMPGHAHSLNGNIDPASVQVPGPDRSLARSVNASAYTAPAGKPVTPLHPQALSVSGGSQPHNNLQPYLTLNFCIALQGVYPSRG
jgi:microcystin-dependent protein